MVRVVLVRGRCKFAGGRLMGDYCVRRVGSGGSGGEGDM